MRVLVSAILLSMAGHLSANNVLTYENAKQRSLAVSNVQYQLQMQLTAESPLYQGEIDLRFYLKDTKNLFLDFSEHGNKIKDLSINGKKSPYRWENSKIYLPEEALKLNAENHVHILFTNTFSNEGKGLHRFVDPEDKQDYIYSNLEPYYANEVFPHFDQPDLKAVYELSVSAPKHWEVIANSRESEVKELNPQYRMWKFQASPKMSSYLFALTAGPFAKWESKSFSGIPLRLFVRKTLAKYIDDKDWFKMTQESLAFQEKSFDYPYPFKKYDQILVPEFANGAMENIGAVIFNEDSYVQRGTPTPLERSDMMDTLSHEMSHMWFGDLVTMKWWDDLWLNESFATFMSYLTIEKTYKTLNLPDPSLSFNASAKLSASLEDSYKSTTHPIVGTVKDTDEAVSSFDAITYEKGASVLKQLYFYVGEEAFFKGLRKYFKQHAFSNTTRHDFLQALSEASGLNLNKWDEEWLRSKGTNSISVDLKVDGDKIKSMTIDQEPDPMDKLLRTHRTLVGLYKYDAQGALKLYKSIPVTYQGAQTEVKEAIGENVPDLVFPNDSDYDLVNISLDAKSLETVYKSLHKVESPLLRQQLYSTLWFMLRNSKVSANEYIKLVTQHALHEDNIIVLDSALSSLRSARTYVPKKSREAASKLISHLLWQRLQKAEPGSPLQTLLFDHYLASATNEHGKELQSWLEGKASPAGMKLDQDRRWSILSALSEMQYAQLASLLQKEKQRDSSSRGLVRAMLVEISAPKVSVKKKWYKEISTPGRMVSRDARTVMGHFQYVLNENLTDFVMEDYFSSILKQVAANEFENKVAHFVKSMYPISYPASFETKVGAFLKEHPELPSLVRKAMLKSVEDSERVRLARLKFQ